MNTKNNGLHIINQDASQLDQKTIIALGAARGGTSMLSGLLVELGVYMGDTKAPKYGDKELSQLISKFRIKSIRRIIKKRDAEYPIWGLKFPSLTTLLIAQFARNPVYLIVYRDIVAIAKRRAMSNDSNILMEMFKSLSSYFTILVFLVFTRRPVLVFSYEKALLEPRSLVSGLCDFLGLPMDEENINKAVAFINPSPDIYISRERFQGDWNGFIDVISERLVAGWVTNTAEPDREIVLELLINKEPVGETLVEVERKDVKDAFPQISRNCGFHFDIPSEKKLGPDDIVEVRVLGEEIYLKSSSLTITDSPGDWNGFIDVISATQVAGWVANMAEPDRKTTVELLINTESVCQTLAEVERKDVKEAFPEISGNCGFHFDIPAGKTLGPDDKVEVRVLGEEVYLKPSSTAVFTGAA